MVSRHDPTVNDRLTILRDTIVNSRIVSIRLVVFYLPSAPREKLASNVICYTDIGDGLNINLGLYKLYFVTKFKCSKDIIQVCTL